MRGYPTLYCKKIRTSKKSTCRTLSQTKYRYGTSTIANDVNFVWPTKTVASLSHWVSTFVYNTIYGRYAAHQTGPSAATEWDLFVTFTGPIASGVLLKMEVGIRKQAWQMAWRYRAYLWSLRWVYAVKKPQRLVYAVYPRIPPPNTPLPIAFMICVGINVKICICSTATAEMTIMVHMQLSTQILLWGSAFVSTRY